MSYNGAHAALIAMTGTASDEGLGLAWRWLDELQWRTFNLAEEEFHAQRAALGCTCYVVRAWNSSGSMFGSDASLGVLCGRCEREMADAEMADAWAAMTDGERIAIRWSNAVWRLRSIGRRPGSPESEVPF